MSDQPKPTGEQDYYLTDELVNKMNPKHSTTGEWTTTKGGIAWSGSGAEISMDNLNLVILHNATLVDAKENSLRDILDCSVVIEQLREQLAAELAKVKEGK